MYVVQCIALSLLGVQSADRLNVLACLGLELS